METAYQTRLLTRKRNGNLPGQGGIFNYVNPHVYHYAGNAASDIVTTAPLGSGNFSTAYSNAYSTQKTVSAAKPIAEKAIPVVAELANNRLKSSNTVWE